MTPVVVVAGLALGVIALLVWRGERARRLHPQDAAFAACTSFGPDLGLSRAARIRRAFPGISDDLTTEWLQDFKRLDDEIDKLARAGGPQRLGDKVVRDRLRRAFPFLVGPGLRQATSLVGYLAMHDGYDTSPGPAHK